MSAKVDEPEEEGIELVKPGEDSSEGFQAAEQPLHLVALAVQLPVVRPGGNSVPLRWDHGRESQLQRQLAGFISLVGPVHE